MSSTLNSRQFEPSGGFPHTQWSVVISAGSPSAVTSRGALEKLCRAYWRPLYAYARRFGYGPHDAQDLTQEFFSRLLAGNYLGSADQEKGRFRTFLLTAMKRFMTNEWHRMRAIKRGGGRQPVQLNTELAESLVGAEALAGASPEHVYDYHCALALLEGALEDMRREYATADKSAEFDALKPFLTSDRREIPYAEIALRLKRDPGVVRVAVHRFRKRYRQHFRDRVAQTLSRAEDMEEEMQHLLKALMP